jgi:hypothetical protein
MSVVDASTLSEDDADTVAGAGASRREPMEPSQRGLRGVVAGAVLVLVFVACGSDSTSPPIRASSSIGPIGSPAPASVIGVVDPSAPSPATTANPTPTPSPSPTPAPSVPATSWTAARKIGRLKTCSTISAGIDAASRYHVAAECAGSIHAYVSSDGRAWKASVFAHPANRQDLDPQIAFWGDTVYVAFTRIRLVEGACGDSGIRDVGVYYRSRTLPDGAWSAPVRIGTTPDRLDTFRVEDGTVHAIVNDGATYETQLGTTFHRYPMPRSDRGTSLRIGSDGRARIAYTVPKGIRYGVFDGSTFSTSPIPGTNGRDEGANLVLDADDKAHIVWTRVPFPDPGLGCVYGEPPPKDQGTYYATNAGGKWVSQQITRTIGRTSLQFDQKTGRIHVLISDRKVRYYTSTGNGTWTASTVPTGPASSPLLRLDPATGTLLIVYFGGPDQADIYAMTKP